MNLLPSKRSSSRYIRWMLGLCRLGIVKRYRINELIAISGHSYGKTGTHFFVQALRAYDQGGDICRYLEEYYKRNTVRSYFEVVGPPISKNYEGYYFLPWDEMAPKRLTVFAGSHKFGPTPAADLDKIVVRLISLDQKIQREGFRQFSVLDGIFRVKELISIEGKRKYLVTDGQHRLAIATRMGIEFVYCFSDAAFLGQLRSSVPIDARKASEWPKVRSGVTTELQAISYFNKIFDDQLCS